MKSFKIIYTLFFVLIISSCDMITEDVQSDVDVLKTELENLQTQINEMESQLNERDSQISDANNQIDDLSNFIDDLSGSLDSNIVYLTQQINDLSNSIDSTDSSLLRQISDLTILLQTLTAQYNELQVSVISIESSISSMDSTISSVENDLKNTVVTLVGNVTASMYEWDDYPNVGPEFKKYLMEMEAKERLYEDIPPINDEEISNMTEEIISGDVVFKLHDTFGFPFDLTALILNERGYNLDKIKFNESMEAQKSRSRAAAESKAEDWVVLNKSESESFIGYDYLTSKVKITQYRKMTTVKDGDFYQLVFDGTPFYPEGGGQVGDKGYLESENGDIFHIFDTKKENNQIIHYCKNIPKKIDGSLNAVVDIKKRQRTSSNHTATHLMHQALRKVLGAHVEQKGSMVHSGMFRFDFSHFTKVTVDELKEVEQFVNDRIQDKIPLEERRDSPYESAIKEGAIALFGEKYDDKVRTIRFGESI